VADEDGVVGLHDHEVLQAAEGDDAPVADGDRVRGVPTETTALGDVARGVGGVVRRERRPGADVVPVELRDDGRDRRGLLEDGVVDRDLRQRGKRAAR
jgi:hypothetical protein